MKYMVVEDSDVDRLTYKVEAYIRTFGWSLLGGVSVDTDRFGKTRYYQAMVQKND